MQAVGHLKSHKCQNRGDRSHVSKYMGSGSQRWQKMVKNDQKRVKYTKRPLIDNGPPEMLLKLHMTHFKIRCMFSGQNV